MKAKQSKAAGAMICRPKKKKALQQNGSDPSHDYLNWLLHHT
jgi:hypothetical protein